MFKKKDHREAFNSRMEFGKGFTKPKLERLEEFYRQRKKGTACAVPF